MGLDVLLAFSLFFKSNFLFVPGETTKTKKQKVLRSLLKLIKHREIRTDDNHATFVIGEKLKILYLKLAIIQKSVRFAGIIELSNMIHKWFFLTPNPLNFNLATVLLR